MDDRMTWVVETQKRADYLELIRLENLLCRQIQEMGEEMGEDAPKGQLARMEEWVERSSSLEDSLKLLKDQLILDKERFKESDDTIDRLYTEIEDERRNRRKAEARLEAIEAIGIDTELALALTSEMTSKLQRVKAVAALTGMDISEATKVVTRK